MPIEMKRGDTAPFARVTLTDANGQGVNLEGASVVIIAADANTKLELFHGNATVTQNGSGTDGTAGQVEYEWQQGDTDEEGNYIVEFEVTYSNGEIQTFPTTDYVEFTITADLGGTV